MSDERPRRAEVASRRDPDDVTLARHIARVAAIFDAVPLGVGVWSVDGELLHANPVFVDLLAESLPDLLGRRFENFIDPTAGPQVRQFVEDLWLGERNHFTCEIYCHRPDGASVPMRAALTAVYGPGARPAYLLSQIFDFTASPLGAIDDALLADLAPVMLWVADGDGLVRRGNRRAHEFVGEPHGPTALARTFLLSAESTDDSVGAQMAAGGPIDLVGRARDGRGDVHLLRHRAEPLRDQRGELIGYLGASTDVTELEQLRRQLDETRRVLAPIVEVGPAAVARLDAAGRVLYLNGRWAELVEDHETQLMGKGWRRLVPSDELEQIGARAATAVDTRQPFSFRVSSTGSPAFLVDPALAPSGARYWAELQIAPVFDAQERHDGWVATLTDVSAEIAAGSRADRLARVLDAGSDFLMITDRSGAITYVNNAAQEVLGVSGGTPSTGASPDFLMDVLDGDSFELFHELVEPILVQEGIWRGELVLRTRAGHNTPVSALMLAHQNTHGRIESISVVARDISDLKVAERQLHQLATHDYLTAMPNRVLLYDRIEQALARFQRYDQPVALLFLDLDGFKPVNDRLGHHVGDQVLRAVAERINSVVRETDTAARVGGDEFCVLVEGIDDPAMLRGVADRLIEVISEPIQIDDEIAQVGVSIGLVSVQESGTDADALIAMADAAMYRAKAAGRGRYVVHDGDRG